MRLIDADALLDGYKNMGYDPTEHPEESYMEGWCKGFNAAVDHCMHHVIHARTIEPERKKGRWVRITQGAIPEKYMCPFCHRTIENDGVESLLSIRFPFCHCGADMSEGEQDG